MPAESLEYHQLHRLGRPGAWRPIVGATLMVFATFILAPLGALVPLIAWLLATGQPVGAGLDSITDFDHVTPLGLAYVNIVLASAIPVAILVNLALHGLGPGWLLSVARRIRWRFFVACLGLSVLALIATVIVSTVRAARGRERAVG